MSSSNNNIVYKKTSFLAGNNSEFIKEFYADYISDPNSLPESWRKFFDGLSDDEKLIYQDLSHAKYSFFCWNWLSPRCLPNHFNGTQCTGPKAGHWDSNGNGHWW